MQRVFEEKRNSTNPEICNEKPHFLTSLNFSLFTVFRIQTVAASENNENQETGNHVNKVNAEDAPV